MAFSNRYVGEPIRRKYNFKRTHSTRVNEIKKKLNSSVGFGRFENSFGYTILLIVYGNAIDPPYNNNFFFSNLSCKIFYVYKNFVSFFF